MFEKQSKQLEKNYNRKYLGIVSLRKEIEQKAMSTVQSPAQVAAKDANVDEIQRWTGATSINRKRRAQPYAATAK
ncbi:hypothetical protein ACFLWG_01600 [Chloroflexota bacterium]